MKDMRPNPSGKKEKAEEAALRLLGRRDHSQEEIRRKLKARGFAATEIEEALRKLTSRRVLDDDRYAQRFALYLAEEKLFGPQRIHQKLFQKGIPADLTQEAMARVEESLPAGERLCRVLRMKLKARCLEQVLPRERRKLANYLRQRGFLWEEIGEAFREAGGFTGE